MTFFWGCMGVCVCMRVCVALCNSDLQPSSDVWPRDTEQLGKTCSIARWVFPIATGRVPISFVHLCN